MAKSGCIKIEFDDSKYSAPVPVIGLYITGATLVCFAFMLYDILSGFVHRKRWIPCRLFSLNSVTLTLLGVTAKLPVDLTTPMSSALDQFSKLTGTTIVCTCMAFLLPSLGINQNSECLTNMAALSIFVVTIVVNICIQIRTGLIILFITEHIIIMCCMLFLLILLWSSALDINHHKEGVHDVRRSLMNLFQGSMLRRLQLAYMYGYSNNPQFLLCKYMYNELVAPLCTLCLVVIIQAASRSLQPKFCRGLSDYDWSIWIIVVTQVLTITLVCFATYFRIFTWFKGEDILDQVDSVETTKAIYFNPVLRNSISARYGLAVEMIMRVLVFLPWFVNFLIKEGLLSLLMVCFEFKTRQIIKEDSNEIREYKEACRKVKDHLVLFDEWSLEKIVKDMKKWMEVSKSRRPLNHLLRLLLKTHHSSKPLDALEIKDELYPDQQGIKLSSLSMVVLVRIAQVSMPSLSASLVEVYSESHEIIHFIFDRINSATFKNRKISQLALAVWRGDNFSRLLPADFFESLPNSVTDDLFHAQEIIKKLQDWSCDDLVCEEAAMIMKFIMCRQYSSIADMYNYIEQLFVDMLHIVLAKLPLATFKYVTESPAEEIEERVKLALKILCQVEPLETHVQWSFPAESNISSLIAATPVPDVIDQIL